METLRARRTWCAIDHDSSKEERFKISNQTTDNNNYDTTSIFARIRLPLAHTETPNILLPQCSIRARCPSPPASTHLPRVSVSTVVFIVRWGLKKRQNLLNSRRWIGDEPNRLLLKLESLDGFKRLSDGLRLCCIHFHNYQCPQDLEDTQ